MAAFIDVPQFLYIDPFEIQCWPPQEVDDILTKMGVEYPELLDAIAGLLVSRSSRFAQDLCPFLDSYMHDHNYQQPLAPADEARLRAMIATPESMVVTEFARLVPLVLQKATTLATETFVQKRPSWVLKALPHLGMIRGLVGVGERPAVPDSPFE